ncbi:MAG: hypothetical protein ACJ76F_01995 [Bacteroidia bacterium]
MNVFFLKKEIEKIPPVYDSLRTQVMENAGQVKSCIYIALGSGLYILFAFLLYRSDITDFFYTAVGMPVAVIFLGVGSIYLIAWYYGNTKELLDYFGPGGELIEGEIRKEFRKDKTYRYEVIFYTNRDERVWITGGLEEEIFSEGDRVTVAWLNGYIQKAALIPSKGKLISLSRHYVSQKADEAHRGITVLHCPGCGGLVPLSEKAEVSCPHCGSAVFIPEGQREIVAGFKQKAELNAEVYLQWKNLKPRKLPRWFFIVINVLPFILLCCGFLAELVLIIVYRKGELFRFETFAFYFWVPLTVFTFFSSLLSGRNLWADDVSRLKNFFMAYYPNSKDEPCQCRDCGAALPLSSDEAFTLCTYCGSENYIVPDSNRKIVVGKKLSALKFRVEDAVQLCRFRKKRERFNSVGRAIAFVLFFIPVCLETPWFDERSQNYWWLLIAIDIWFLTICSYFIFREAFLPPIEDADWLPPGLSSEMEASGKRNPKLKTRSFYGPEAFERQNYMVPLIPLGIYICLHLAFIFVN